MDTFIFIRNQIVTFQLVRTNLFSQNNKLCCGEMVEEIELCSLHCYVFIPVMKTFLHEVTHLSDLFYNIISTWDLLKLCAFSKRYLAVDFLVWITVEDHMEEVEMNTSCITYFLVKISQPGHTIKHLRENQTNI